MKLYRPIIIGNYTKAHLHLCMSVPFPICQAGRIYWKCVIKTLGGTQMSKI